MKQILFAIICCISSVAYSQYVSIPDSNFGNWLYYNVCPQCLVGNGTVGWQMDTTCHAVVSRTYFQESYLNLGDITGIQYFDSIVYMEFEYCGITNIPALPGLLTTLICPKNHLTSLPPLPNSLAYLKCDSNLLTSMPPLPNFLNTFSCGHNPNLLCLPKLNSIQDFRFASTGITCLPNYPQGNTYSYPVLSSVPVCDSANANGCSFCHPYFSIYPDSVNTGVYYGFNQSSGTNITSYLWQFGDGSSSIAQYPSHTYTTAGQYNICLTVSGSDCTNTYCDSSYLVFKTDNGLMNQLNILSPLGINEVGDNFRISISPNPATDQLFIETNGVLVEEINIYNATGSLISQNKKPQNKSIDISQLAIGVYIAEIKTKEASVKRRWVKM